LGQACNHIAALLFFIDDHIGDDNLPAEVSKTSQPMKWNQPPKKEIAPARAQDILFVKPSHTDSKKQVDEIQCISKSQFDPRHPLHRSIQEDKFRSLLVNLQRTLPDTGLQQFWLKRSDDKCDDGEVSRLWRHVIFWHESVTTVCVDKFHKPTSAECFDYMNSMSLSPDEVQCIEKATRGQADNNLWLALHNGRITSSRFAEIFHRRPSTNSRRLVKEIMGYGERMKNLPPQIRWGRDNEHTARKCYLQSRSSNGETIVFEPTGLYLLPEKSFLGASSDGKLLCTSVDTCCYGCLEIKCPYSIDGTVTVNLTPYEIADKFGNKFCLQNDGNGILHLPRNHPYFAQVQGEMAIMNVEWCDFAVFSNGQVVVDRILADYDYWLELSEAIDRFYVQHVVPEILSGAIFTDEYNSILEF